jgi:hypothetical protein
MWMCGRRMRVGWLVAIFTEMLWVAYAISTRQWGFIAGAALYMAVFARNWTLWGRNEQTVHLRVAVLEDAIRQHRRMVRDGWVSRWRPDRDPDGHLWDALGADRG